MRKFKKQNVKHLILGGIFILLWICTSKVMANNLEEGNIENIPLIEYQTHVQEEGWQDWKNNGEMAGTSGKSLRLEGIKIQSEEINVNYQVHVQDIGWQEWKSDGEIAGTSGRSLRLEAIRISLDSTANYSVMYRVHVQDIGWQEWKSDGEIAGTSGRSLRLEAIEIKIVDKIKKAKIYIDRGVNQKTYYQEDTLIEIKGWRMANFSDNVFAVYIDNKQIEGQYIKNTARPDVLLAIEGYGTETENPNPGFEFDVDITNLEEGKHTIKINVETDGREVIQSYIYEFNIDRQIHIKYQTHIQDIGWQNEMLDGELSGTEGKGLRLEALKINLINLPEDVKIKYKTHVENIGWQDWKYDGELSGTEGKSYRIEALKIELENLPDYSIQYRTHIQDIGWQGWANDGEISGTTGKSKRIEAIQIRIVPKIQNKIKGGVETTVASKIKKDILTIKGWLMTDIENVKIQVMVNNELTNATITRKARPDILEKVKGYGGEVKNPTPGYEIRLDFSNSEYESKKIKIQYVDENEKVLLEENVINTEVSKVIIEYISGTYGKTGFRAANVGGSYLPYLKYGCGENVLFATFAMHAFEDLWDKDGQELVDIANQFYNKLLQDKDYALAEKWTIYVFPGINLDGLSNGYTKDGPGRTTLYSKAPNNKGIDLNRCWQIGNTYKRYTTDRNYNGTAGFQAYEAEALRDFMLANKSQNGQTVVVDLHGWTQQLIGDPQICSYYEKQFPENDKSGVGRYGTGYMVDWARTYLGSSAGPAKAALIELPNEGVTGHQSVVNKQFANRYITATLEMLESII